MINLFDFSVMGNRIMVAVSTLPLLLILTLCPVNLSQNVQNLSMTTSSDEPKNYTESKPTLTSTTDGLAGYIYSTPTLPSITTIKNKSTGLAGYIYSTPTLQSITTITNKSTGQTQLSRSILTETTVPLHEETNANAVSSTAHGVAEAGHIYTSSSHGNADNAAVIASSSTRTPNAIMDKDNITAGHIYAADTTSAFEDYWIVNETNEENSTFLGRFSNVSELVNGSHTFNSTYEENATFLEPFGNVSDTVNATEQSNYTSSLSTTTTTTTTNECLNNPCGLHGDCIFEPGTFTCQCHKGWGNTTCNQKLVPLRSCIEVSGNGIFYLDPNGNDTSDALRLRCVEGKTALNVKVWFF